MILHNIFDIFIYNWSKIRNIMTNFQKLRTRPPKINYPVIKSSNDNMTAQYTFSGSWAYQILPLR